MKNRVLVGSTKKKRFLEGGGGF